MPHVIIHGATGGVHPRKDIYKFVRDTKQFSLFIQALTDLENLPWKDQLSFFALGGIHGYPYVPWEDSREVDSTTDTSKEEQDQWKGYCTHGSVLFPTWHRPYVAAVEQFIHERAVKKAKEYAGPDASLWADAAERLRMPYWDWTTQALPPPEVIEYKMVDIVTPQGEQTVQNPLYQFNFKESVEDFPTRFNHWQKTLRHPTSKGPSADSDDKELERTLKANFKQTRESWGSMLSQVHDWATFSNHKKTNPPHISLEGIHDSIHVFVGGGGHMGTKSVAGFDPIFYLHHSNVDRLLSIWAHKNPQVWVSPGNSEDGTRTIPENTTVNESTALTPFWNTELSYWTSNLVRSTDALGYTYEEVMVEPGNADNAQQQITKRIETLYGSPYSALFSRLDQPEAAEPGGTEFKSTSTAANPTSHGVHDWKVRVRVEELALGESFQVLIFLGPVPPIDDYKDWMSHPNYVGCVSAFVNDVPELCANCTATRDKIIQGVVYLSETIAEKSGLPGSLEPHVVSPYLEEKLSWSVRKVMGGVPVPLDDVPSLEVTVFSALLTKQEGSAFPNVGEHIHHRHITRGKIGGHRVTDEEA